MGALRSQCVGIKEYNKEVNVSLLWTIKGCKIGKLKMKKIKSRKSKSPLDDAGNPNHDEVELCFDFREMSCVYLVVPGAPQVPFAAF